MKRVLFAVALGLAAMGTAQAGSPSAGNTCSEPYSGFTPPQALAQRLVRPAFSTPCRADAMAEAAREPGDRDRARRLHARADR